MMIKRIFQRKLITLIISSYSFSCLADLTQIQLGQVEQCRQTTTRIDRLACFDHLFNVRLNEPLDAKLAIKPPSWNRAVQAVKDSASDTVLVTEGEGRGSQAWIVLKAINEQTHFPQNAKPALMISCIDNLSRIELVLPFSIEAARVQLSFNRVQQIWRNDDSGLVLSSARGLPAIDMMRNIMQENHLLLRSNAESIDGLLFDTRQVPLFIDALRRRCGW